MYKRQGANCIYPIIGHTEYGWTFVGTDIDPVSIENARKIVTCNPVLAHKIDLRLQKDSKKIFDGIITVSYTHLYDYQNLLLIPYPLMDFTMPRSMGNPPVCIRMALW